MDVHKMVIMVRWLGKLDLLYVSQFMITFRCMGVDGNCLIQNHLPNSVQVSSLQHIFDQPLLILYVYLVKATTRG